MVMLDSVHCPLCNVFMYDILRVRIVVVVIIVVIIIIIITLSRPMTVIWIKLE